MNPLLPPTSLGTEERNDYLERRERERQFYADAPTARSSPNPSRSDRRKISAWLTGGLRQHLREQRSASKA